MIILSLTQRAHFLILAILLSIFSVSAYSQTVIESTSTSESVEVDMKEDLLDLESDDLDMMAEEVEAQAQVVEDSKVKTILRKIADRFKKSANYLKNKVNSTTEKQKSKRLARKERRLKRRASIENGSASKFTKILYKIGKGSSDVANAISKPFVNSTGFLTGFFEKESKNREATALMKLILKNDDQFDHLYENTGTALNYAVKFKDQIENLINNKMVVVLSDSIYELTGDRLDEKVILKTIGVSPYAEDNSIETIGAKIKDKVFKIDQSKFKVSLINEHPEFQELRAILGDVKSDEFAEVLLEPNFVGKLDYNALLGGSRMKVSELVVAFAGRFFVPKIALGLVSSSLSSVVLGASAAVSVFDIIGIGACTVHKGNLRKLNNDEDQDLKDFCSYMVNKAMYDLSKSRAKGYVAGKNTKAKLNDSKLSKFFQKKKTNFKKGKFNQFLKKTFKKKNSEEVEKSKTLNSVKLM